MKKRISSPIFELAFAGGIVAILALPLLVTAQDHKEFKVTINNSDTTVNGKNIKELTPAERTDAMKKINDLNDHISVSMSLQTDGSKGVTIKRKKGDNNSEIILDGQAMSFAPMARAYSFRTDSNGKSVEVMTNRTFADGRALSGFEYSTTPRVRIDASPRAAISINGFNRKNTQNFSYSNTDNDGISTRVNFRVGDASSENLKKITGAEKADLEINDLNLVPQFSTGKTMLSFSVAAKTTADVTFKDSDGAVLWSGKTATGEFSKSFQLPKNGVYYLQVKQAGKLALRKIVKEE